MDRFKLPGDTIPLKPPMDGDVQLGMGRVGQDGEVAPQLVIRDDTLGMFVVTLTAKQLMYLAATSRSLLMSTAEQIGRLAAQMEQESTDE